METADTLQFGDALRRLGRTMSHAVDTETVEDYFETLKEFPLSAILKALEHVRKTAKFWPRPSVIRDACALAPGVASLTTIPAWVDPMAEKWFCGACWDTGFTRGLTCPGDGRCHIGHCGGLAGQATEHPYTRRCSCVATNPVMVRERDIQRQRTVANQERT